MSNKTLRDAMQVALRMAGGRVGYAEGGNVSDAKMARQIQERAMRGLEPTPEQQKYLKHMEALKSGNSERLSGFLLTAGKEVARALSPPIPGWSAPSQQEWEAQNKERHAGREGMSEGQRFAASLGDFAMEGLPYALPEIGAGAGALLKAFPKTTGAVAGSLGMLAAPAQAGSGESPEQIKERQKILAAAGLYKGAIDGEDGFGTREAQKAFDSSAAARDAREVEKIKAQAALANAQAAGKETERRATEGDIAENKRKKGEERFQEAEKNLDPFNRVVRDWGPTAGYVAGAGLGMLGKWGVNKASNAMSKNAATRADTLLSKDAPDLAARAANVNQFWSEGQPVPLFGSRTAPFEANPGNIPAFKANPKAAPSTDLYLPDRAKNAGVDAGVAGAFGAESLYAQEVMGPHAQQELAQARTAFKDDPSESNLARLQSALNQAAAAEALTNLGRAGGISYLASGVKMHRDPTRPDISKAEAERTRIDELLSGKGGPAASPGTPALPPPLPTAGPSGSAGAPILPGLPPVPAPTSIPSQPAGIAQLGKGPSTEVAGAASSSPEIVFVPMVQSPSGTLHYPSRDSLPEALRDQLRPGGWAKNEHRPAKKEVARKKAASKSAENPESAQPSKRTPQEPADMADVPVKPDKLPDDPSLLTRGMNRGGAIGRAFDVVARAMGGSVVHTGPTTHRADGGRTDTVPVDLPSHSYVLPSDIVSSLGQGDTNAGYRVVEQMFGHHETKAAGGAVPAIIAGGEYVLSPEQVQKIGGGDPRVGFQALDQWVKMQRRKTIQTLKGLPPPVKD